jgi:RimJ/RimL family protein N-acetyltransferase
MITFRPHSRDDLALRVKWLNNQEAIKFAWDAKEPATEETESKWLDDYENNPGKKFFTIYSDDTPIGFIGLRKIDEAQGIGNVFILIGEDDYRGKGIGLIAMNWLIDYAFNVLKLDSLDLEVDKRHTHAIELYKSLNFQVVGEDARELKMLLIRDDTIK